MYQIAREYNVTGQMDQTTACRHVVRVNTKQADNVSDGLRLISQVMESCDSLFLDSFISTVSACNGLCNHFSFPT
jgi:hypothetical protein